ncbi:MAG: hypothetical protein WA718_19505 [Terriglobales bacterium]
MLLQKRIERKTASLLLYALQIASSNLKRVELEKPQPEQVVADFDTEYKMPIAALGANETESDPSEDSAPKDERSDENLPPGTIQACEGRELSGASGLASHPSRKGREGWGTHFSKRRENCHIRRASGGARSTLTSSSQAAKTTAAG